MTGDELEARIRSAIARALGSSTEAVGPSPAMGATPGWDSIGHMNVVMGLEAEFGTTFPAYRLPELVNVPSIARLLRDVSPKG